MVVDENEMTVDVGTDSAFPLKVTASKVSKCLVVIVIVERGFSIAFVGMRLMELRMCRCGEPHPPFMMNAPPPG